MLCEKPRKFSTAAGLLPCGVCRPCRINRRRDWTTRLSLEAKAHDENLWITLTYAPEFVPTHREREKDGRCFGSKEYPTLWRPDYQNFFKRLRNYGLPEDFKYFLVGEYGEKYQRPHYHACLFGIGDDYKDRILRAWCTEDSDGHYRPIGHIYFGNLEAHSIQYTAGYTVKKMTSFDHEDLHGRYPEFPAPSKGLSLDSVRDIISAMQILKLNDLPPYVVVNGRKVPIPRYLKNKVRAALGINQPLPAYSSVSRYYQSLETLSDSRRRWLNEMFALQICSKDTSLSISDQWKKENRQSLLNQSAKMKLFFEKEKLL